MANYKADLRDIYFNLFNQLKIQDNTEDYGTEDLKEILEQFNKFVENEIFPSRQEGDSIGVNLNDGKVTVPPSFIKAKKQFYENGWFALGYPESIGGMPAPVAIDFACTSLYVGANVSFSLYTGLSKGAMNVIHEIGTQDQKDKFIPHMMSGQWGGTMCLTESGAGSDVGASKTTAKANQDGSYNIQGVKIFISSGDNNMYDNIIHLVLAKLPDAPEGTKGLSLFIVPKFIPNNDGTNGDFNYVVCTKIEEKMGIHGSATCELTFGANKECKGWAIGKENEGMANMFIMMNEARLLCGIQGESQAALAYELTRQYTSERSQFGIEIEKFPDVKRTLLRMRSMSRGMRSLALYTADLFDKEKKGHTEVSKEIALLTPICKSLFSDEGFNIAIDAIQLHGGYGFCSEYGIEQFARDTKIATIYEGTNGIQAIDFVMRKVLKDNGVTFSNLIQKIQRTMKDALGIGLDNEISVLENNLEKGQEILTMYGDLAKAKKMDDILFSTTDFQKFCGYIILAWRLLDAAQVASSKIETSSGEEKVYLESKINDFKVFCQQYLSKNTGISQSILNFEQSLGSIAL